MIELSAKWEEEKMNNNELFREVFSYTVDGKRADMMSVIEHNGYTRAYNMDADRYYDEGGEGEEIPKDILSQLEDMATAQIKADYKKTKA